MYIEKENFKMQKLLKHKKMLSKNYKMNLKTFFSTGSSDIGKTPLIEMEIDTGDNPPITQKPYTLPLKHATWDTERIRDFRDCWSDSEKCFTLG